MAINSAVISQLRFVDCETFEININANLVAVVGMALLDVLAHATS